jgi:hypothetical protein
MVCFDFAETGVEIHEDLVDVAHYDVLQVTHFHLNFAQLLYLHPLPPVSIHPRLSFRANQRTDLTFDAF